MAEDDQPTSFHTSQEESLRQAEAAFGGAVPKQPDALPTGAPVATPVGVPGVRRPRRFLRRAIVLVVVLGLIGGVGFGLYSLIKSAVDDATSPGRSIPSIPGIPSIPSVPTPSQPESPSRPAPSGNNFTVAGLTRSRATALKLAGRGARIEFARVAADQLQLIVRSGSRRRVVLVSAALTRTVDTPGGGLTGNEVGFETFSPVTLVRIVGAIGRRYHVPASRIDYAVLLRNPVTKSVDWLVYPRGGGGHFQADVRGGSLRRVG